VPTPVERGCGTPAKVRADATRNGSDGERRERQESWSHSLSRSFSHESPCRNADGLLRGASRASGVHENRP
jgi:hypothetical protein